MDTKRSIRALYSYCRTLDDIADSQRLRPEQKLRALDNIESAVKAGQPARFSAAIWPALYDTAKKHKLPTSELMEVLSGVRSDIRFAQPASLSELDRYSYQVAGVVGVMSARILGAYKASTLEGAKQLGIAMQYTNIIRDVGSDAMLGRVYLPKSYLRDANMTSTEVKGNLNQPALERILIRLSDRAETYYQHSLPSIKDLHASFQLPVQVAYELYHAILDRVKQKQYTVRHERIRLNRLEKLLVVWRVIRSRNK